MVVLGSTTSAVCAEGHVHKHGKKKKSQVLPAFVQSHMNYRNHFSGSQSEFISLVLRQNEYQQKYELG